MSKSAIGWLMSITIVGTFSERIPAGDEGKEAIDVIVRHWNERRQLATSVQAAVKGSRTTTKGTLGDGWPKEDRTLDKKVSWVLHFANNWLRKEAEEFHFMAIPGIYDFVPGCKVELYDGKRAQMFEPREKNTSSKYTPSEVQPDLLTSKHSVAGLFLNEFDLPILMAFGLIPTHKGDPTATRLVPPLEAQLFLYQGKGSRDGFSCLILRTLADKYGYVGEFWVDCSRTSAIVSYILYRKGKIRSQNDIRYKKTGETWVPDSWRTTFFQVKGDVETVDDVSVTHLSLNPVLEKGGFQQAIKPGMVVVDNDTHKYYRVREDGSLGDLAITPRAKGIPLLVWLAIAATFSGAVVVSWRYFRKGGPTGRV